MEIERKLFTIAFDLDTTHLGLTRWGRVTQICVGTLTTIGSDSGLAPTNSQAIIWTDAEILLMGP